MNIMNFFSRKRKYYFIASVRDAKQEVDDITKKKLEIFQMIINMRIMTAAVGVSLDQRKKLFRQLPKTGLI